MPASSKAGRADLLKKNALISVGLSTAYLLVSYLLIGYRPEQLVLVIIFLGLFNSSPISRQFVIGFSIFIIYWILFDYMKAFPNYRFHRVDIRGIYQLEKTLFGITSNGQVLTPNEFLLVNKTTFLDIVCGLFYLCWIPVPLLMGVYLFFKKRREFICFALTFLLVNLLGFVIYYSHPAAPPWYVQTYGFRFLQSVPGNTAGLGRFDNYFNTQIFKSIYEKSSNVFAAMPSLHSSYPAIVLFYGIRNKLGSINILFGIVTLGIWFAAVYTSHHYILDVLSGILCAAAGITIFRLLLAKSEAVNRLIAGIERVIT